MARPKSENPVRGGSVSLRRAGDKAVFVRMSPVEHQAIREAAAAQPGKSMSQLCRELIVAGLESISGKKGK